MVCDVALFPSRRREGLGVGASGASFLDQPLKTPQTLR